MKSVLPNPVLLFIVSGIVCIAEGVAICLWPETSFNNRTYLFAFPIILHGSIQSFYGIQRIPEHLWLIVLYFLGIVNLAAGCLIIFYRGLTEFVFNITIATAWASTGIAMLFFAYCLRGKNEPDFRLFLSGIFSITAGIYVIINVQKAIITMLWPTAVYEFVFGTIIVLFGLRAKA